MKIDVFTNKDTKYCLQILFCIVSLHDQKQHLQIIKETVQASDDVHACGLVLTHVGRDL